jgi:hypothetical protein
MQAFKTQRLVLTIGILLALGNHNTLNAWGTNQRNDPFPSYTSVDPQYFLQQREKDLMLGLADEKGTPERVMISISPFGQNADQAKTLGATYCQYAAEDFPQGQCAALCEYSVLSYPVCWNGVNIGDIDGRWNLLGLIAGPLPVGFNSATAPLLVAAAAALFPGIPLGEITANDIQVPNTDIGIPGMQTSGFVSVPLKYRKRGVRWDIEAQICGDFGLQFQGGFVEITQVLNPNFINLTTGDFKTCNGDTIPQITFNCVLFDPLVQLAAQLGLNICNFTNWGFEDLYLALYWRHAHVINFNRDLSWARFLLIPFARIAGGLATGKPKHYDYQFSLPFGNNGSNSINVCAGMNFDFAETVEIGGELGYSHFFKKDFANFRVPTNPLQSGIYPFATNVSVKPGPTAYFAAKLAAYHFIDRLSFFFQWAFVHHRFDHIEILSTDPAFLVSECPVTPTTACLPQCPNTAWRVQLGNFAFNYDLTPNVSLGFLWQQMFHVRNAYNSTTILFNVNLIF